MTTDAQQTLRRVATPLTMGAFFLVATTGLLMFFGISSGLNRGVHEWMSWAFLTGVGAHLTVHVKSFRRHLASPAGRGFLAFFAALLVLSFYSWGVRDSDKVIEASARSLADVPITTLANVVHVTPAVVKARLHAIGVEAQDGQTIHQLADDHEEREVEIMAVILRVDN
jgi:hypothetical protein